MAIANWSSSAMVKAVVVPFILVLLAVAAGASIAEDGSAVAKSGGRFSETPVGRKLLQSVRACGSGSAPNYNCTVLLGPSANNATCCTDKLGNQGCWDVGASWLDKCGSCNTTCSGGKVCCRGACTDLQTDRSNCGTCGNICRSTLECKFSLCGY